MDIQLPSGLTWQSPVDDLYRALYPQNRELAELIGAIPDAEEVSDKHDAEVNELERKAKRALDSFNDIAADIQSALNKLDDAMPKSGAMHEKLMAVAEMMEALIVQVEEAHSNLDD